MREPRAKQRFPHGGKDLYELLRLDHEPALIFAWPSDEVSANHVRYPIPDTLVFERAFDPMVYFWPVEGQHIVVNFKRRPEESDVKRLVKALERDGAGLITLMWKDDKNKLQWEHFGDAGEFIYKRYGVSPLEFMALPRGGS